LLDKVVEDRRPRHEHGVIFVSGIGNAAGQNLVLDLAPQLHAAAYAPIVRRYQIKEVGYRLPKPRPGIPNAFLDLTARH
jgi:hypothetical protein